MRQLQITNKPATLIAFVFSLLICKGSSANFHGIRIPDEIKDKLVSSLEPEVDIKQGTLQGTAELSRNGRVYFAFRGIPFGKVVRRFDIAQPADAWKGVRKAKEYGPQCAQVDLRTRGLTGVEDCLTLNVFVPKTNSSLTSADKLPVMFYIYGGGFIIGESSSYDPRYFMDEDIILVTINYRVGAFGFFNAGLQGASGNQGWKDLVLGLKWVQDNIEQGFGGDASRVTIFGLSAGGASVAALVVSPMAKGLFRAAIAQSSIAIAPISVFPDPEFQEVKKLANALDCPTSNAEYMVECLRTVKPELLVKATVINRVWFERTRVPLAFPTIETYKESESDPNVFLSENPETILKEGRFNRVPFMTGVVSHEGLSGSAGILRNPNSTKELNERWGRVAPQAFFYWNAAKDPCVVSTKLKNAYLDGKPVDLDNMDGLTKIVNDIGFQYPARKIGILHSEYAPVYFYNFTRSVARSVVDAFGWKHPDPSMKPPVHSDDVQFHFSGSPSRQPIEKDSPDYEFSANFVKLFTSFATHGKPTHFWGPKVQSMSPINATDSKHLWLTIDNELSLVAESNDFLKRMELIDGIRKNDFDLPA